MFWKEKHTRIFLTEILCIACLALTAGLALAKVQENRMRSFLFEHDAAIASSLLEQGVAKQAVAEAVLCAEPLAAGRELLYQIGRSETADISSMPDVYRFCAAERIMVSLGGALFFLLLALSVLRYLQKRDRLYRDAISVIENYTENDFSRSLPDLCEGTLFQLFSRINFMAAMLKTKQEAENKGKEFLKTTVSDISHQLKAPLAALSMYQEIILSEPDKAQTVVAFTKKSGFALSRMEGLIRNLLKITRLDAESVMFSKKHFAASEFVLQAVEELTDRAQKEKKELAMAGDKEAEVFCDMEWSREALANIIKNALDHTDEGDRITIAWEQTPLMTRFMVTDTGEGIAEEDIHHIFKRFYRSADNRDRQGTGLGLSLARSIMDGQGGTISVRSEAGYGTTFTLSFPAGR